jgi:hypothetical protein
MCKYYRANNKCINKKRKFLWIFHNDVCGRIFDKESCKYYKKSIRPELKPGYFLRIDK